MSKASASSRDFREEYLELLHSQPELDLVGRKEAADYVSHSQAVYHGEVVEFLYIPKLYSAADLQHFKQLTAITYRILCKVIKHYVSDPAYRRHFGFSSELEELILLDPGYNCPLPITRMDIFYNEDSGDFQFCEFNTDGSSAMNEDREISTALSRTPTFRTFAQRHKVRPFELVDSWVQTLLDIYKGSKRPVSAPHLGIVDFLDLSTPYEIEYFRERFNAVGIDTSIYDLRELKYRGGKLVAPDGRVLDVVYRRAVTTDIMAHYTEVDGFLDAVRAEAVTLIGSFRTQVPHAKTVFSVLHLPDTFAFLTSEEQAFVRAHIPHTMPLATDQQLELNEVIRNKDAWILKPVDSYAAQGVVAGRELSCAAWEQFVRKQAACSGTYLAQTYVEQYEAPNLRPGFRLVEGQEAVLLPQPQPPHVKNYRDLTGLFVYAGKFQGFLARAGLKDTICAAADGNTLGTFSVE